MKSFLNSAQPIAARSKHSESNPRPKTVRGRNVQNKLGRTVAKSGGFQAMELLDWPKGGELPIVTNQAILNVEPQHSTGLIDGK